MKEYEVCSQESMILAAQAGGHWNDALRQHLDHCASCRLAVDLAVQIRQLTATGVTKLPPDADVVWMMAQVSKPRPGWTAGTLEGIMTMAACALLAVWSWPAITGYLSILVPPPAMAVVPMLAACIVAAGLGIAAFTTNRV